LTSVETSATGQKCIIIGAPQPGQGSSPAPHKPAGASHGFTAAHLTLERAYIKLGGVTFSAAMPMIEITG